MTRALTLAVMLLWLAAVGLDGLDRWVQSTDVPSLVVAHSVEVRDRTGEMLRAYTVDNGIWRLRSDLDHVDPLYLQMLTAYEDRRFATHTGVDPRAMIRAAWQSLRAGRITSGGSTLTMQVARLIEQSGTGSWQGKWRQIRLALALERRLDKDDILSLYIALAPMGGNLEGLRAASLSYFGKAPRRLTPAEAALLVALPQSPEARRPDRAPMSARDARDRVLERAVRFGALTGEEAAAARQDPIPTTRRTFPLLAPHLADLARTSHPDSPVIATTLDRSVQQGLESLTETVLARLSPRLSLAILAADHQSGEIIASVGSRGLADAGQGFVDMTRAIRSPGSTLKPLVYGLAFDQGLAHPETLISDRPMAFDGYAPQNFDGQYRGDLPVAEALRLSLNIPAVQLTQTLGPQHVMAALRRAGATPRLRGQPGLAIALGGLGISLTDLVQLYAGIADGGQARALHWQPGHGDDPRGTILTRASAWHLGHILSRMSPPPGAPADRLAYKTGTSYGHRDAWAVGYDGRHVIGVWMGRPDGTPVPGAFGGDLAAPILFQAFARLKPAFDPLPPPPPETLLLGASQLPEPLRRFSPRGTQAGAGHPQLSFPPDGATLAAEGAIPAKVRQGQPPFTWLTNGQPLMTAHTRDVMLPDPGQGFSTITVIDAAGRSARSRVRVMAD